MAQPRFIDVVLYVNGKKNIEFQPEFNIHQTYEDVILQFFAELMKEDEFSALKSSFEKIVGERDFSAVSVAYKLPSAAEYKFLLKSQLSSITLLKSFDLLSERDIATIQGSVLAVKIDIKKQSNGADLTTTSSSPSTSAFNLLMQNARSAHTQEVRQQREKSEPYFPSDNEFDGSGCFCRNRTHTHQYACRMSVLNSLISKGVL